MGWENEEQFKHYYCRLQQIWLLYCGRAGGGQITKYQTLDKIGSGGCVGGVGCGVTDAVGGEELISQLYFPYVACVTDGCSSFINCQL